MIISEKGFFVGDACYVLDDEVYHGVWGKKYRYSDGEIRVNDTLAFSVEGTGSDGYFTDADDNGYEVDAGIICAVPLELVTKRTIEEAKAVGTVFTGFNRAETDSYDNYIIINLYSPTSFKRISICTGN